MQMLRLLVLAHLVESDSPHNDPIKREHCTKLVQPCGPLVSFSLLTYVIVSYNEDGSVCVVCLSGCIYDDHD